MSRAFHTSGLAFIAIIGLTAQPALAETPGQILDSIQSAAKATPGFKEFSAARGESFFRAKQSSGLSCASCHTDNPAAPGKHEKTGKDIEPLAPSANAQRFGDPAKVAKWFKRNCHEVLSRACTPQEQGDFLAYLLTIKK